MNKSIWQKLDRYNLYAYLFFVFLIVWALVTKEERILISDPAYYFFHIVNKADFFYPGVRYTAIINQFPLVLATRMQLPLDTLLSVYSVSFVLVRLFYFFLANNVFKNKAAGYAVIAISFVGVAESYFRPTSESTIALLNSIALYAWLTFADTKIKQGKWKQSLIVFVNVLFIVFGYVSHPIALFSLFFVIAYHSLERNKFKSMYPYLSFVILFAVFTFKVFLSKSGYQHNSVYGNLLESPLSILTELKTYYPYKFFILHFKWIYYPYAVLLVAAIAISIKKTRWYVPVFLVLYSFVYFVVACASFKEGDANMQMEKIFLPNAMFAALVFASVVTKYSHKYRFVLSLIGVIVLGMSMNINIRNYKPKYTQRINDLHMVAEEANKLEARKLVITPKQVERLPLAYCWAYGIETLIISTIDSNMDPLTVFIARNPEEIKKKMDDPGNFMPAAFDTSSGQKYFNKNYFNLPEQSYVIWDKVFGE
ncbi:hypothetical protein INQ51_04710 [Maribellus sp. CM-23]|uniref:hypothetical protein n=1 Tax=Maribellus sp. CM-23 TaxID=2781026 RepID=UPI001F22A320|nr:hypothetical protein [Maribellus sp. CM-23]MCE4563602.1 hypothetical protein [Maribellus sp. CM-23]